MKPETLNTVLSPIILILAVLFAAVAFIGIADSKVPLVSCASVNIILLLVLGMAMCTLGGIGRVAAAGQWTHPLAILGHLLGGAILLVALSVFAGWKLPLIQTDQQAILAIAILTGSKVVNAVLHNIVSHI